MGGHRCLNCCPECALGHPRSPRRLHLLSPQHPPTHLAFQTLGCQVLALFLCSRWDHLPKSLSPAVGILRGAAGPRAAHPASKKGANGQGAEAQREQGRRKRAHSSVRERPPRQVCSQMTNDGRLAPSGSSGASAPAPTTTVKRKRKDMVRAPCLTICDLRATKTGPSPTCQVRPVLLELLE